MATYAIGDLQGCYEPFMRLLERIHFDPDNDRLWLVGDLVNRGPHSLETLRFLVRHSAAVTAVLGNHDVYALARAHDVTKPTDDETLAELLAAPDRDELFAWLGQLPFLHEGIGHTLVHAGLLPQWDLETARTEARAAEAALRQSPALLLHAYFNQKRQPWSPTLRGVERLVATIGVFTRIRFVDGDGRFVAGSGAPEAPPTPGLVPWFRKRRDDATFVFGHWASLGLWLEGKVLALDSGCVWNGSLTALRLEDRSVFSVTNRKEAD